jgi:hypothetical protein
MPTATEFLPLAVLFAPKAELLSPLAVLFAPTAVLLLPVAVLLSPIAVPVGPTVAEPVLNTTESPLESSDVELSAVSASVALPPTAKLAVATTITAANRSLTRSTLFAATLSMFNAMTPPTERSQGRAIPHEWVNSTICPRE